MSAQPSSLKLALFFVASGTACFLIGRYTKSDEDRPDTLAPPPTRQSPGSADLSTSVNSPASARENQPNRLPAWNELKAKPATPANARDQAALLEKLAISDPQQSLSLAQTEPNLMLRENFLQAVLRGWAQSAPLDAAHYALTLALPSSREAGLSSVFSGAVTANPQTAIQAGQHLLAENPTEAVGLGNQLIDALCHAGSFQAAADFAATGDGNSRSFWMGDAFSKWASFQPQQAAQAASAITDPDLRSQALHGVVGGWSTADPASLVQYVVQLPASADKASLISQSLQRWAKTNPVAASDWINNHEGGPEMDQGIASVATMEALKPDVAIGWAESINSPKLRSETLVSVLRSWSTTDLAATKNYFEKTSDLLPEDREEIMGVIKTLSGQAGNP